ncbi:MAG TPA: daptide-type RiPP [Streptomyces sp.]
MEKNEEHGKVVTGMRNDIDVVELVEVEELEELQAPGFWDTVGGFAVGAGVVGGGLAIGIAIT